MLKKLRLIQGTYPAQFRLMGAGLLVSSAGASLIWPFLMIYVSENLSLSLSKASSLITINAATGLLASFIAGSIADKVGRKLVMVTSLLLNGLGYFLMSQTHTYLGFAGLMVLMGASNPLYQVGADAMLADLIPAEGRLTAYALIRMINNVGIAIGPAVGGFLATISYSYAFWGASAGMLIYGLLLILRARETLPAAYSQAARVPERLGGYGRVLRDRTFVAFALLIGLGLIAPSMVWTLVAVYAKQNYGLSENLYGWLPTTNGIMCVVVQIFVTRFFSRYRSLSVATMGMFTFAVGVGTFAIMTTFWGFWIGMVIMTMGELILIPTTSKYISDLAPADMRGRYMSFYWFAWGIARAIAPLIGGFLNDNIAPRSIWIGGLIFGLASTIGLFFMSRRKINTLPEPAISVN